MEKKEAQKFWEKAEKQLKELSSKAVKIAKRLQEQALYGVKIGKLKVEELGLESKKAKIFQQIGTETFKLVKEHKFKNNKISKLCAEIDAVNREIKKKRANSASLKKKISEGINKLK